MGSAYDKFMKPAMMRTRPYIQSYPKHTHTQPVEVTLRFSAGLLQLSRVQHKA